jgi:hypothetical protein
VIGAAFLTAVMTGAAALPFRFFRKFGAGRSSKRA